MLAVRSSAGRRTRRENLARSESFVGSLSARYSGGPPDWSPPRSAPRGFGFVAKKYGGAGKSSASTFRMAGMPLPHTRNYKLRQEQKVDGQGWLQNIYKEQSCKVVKSCAEIEGKLSTMEERTMAVEADIEALRVQTATHDGQLNDIMWKLEDQENQQMRNNLRFLGIKEGEEGNNIRAYMIKMLQDAFPELTN
ncbi:hypothetical protein NDU88_010665 [Pleurodeles waltl]|uniref:Uncharacterized protein n=1 Tax=Pleurodeles waltl TaxID=8319 RepID=A0AAV7QV09_PLEWA|nr:hypothetical protein NDU88_010665 [Pleurodeles waltl]